MLMGSGALITTAILFSRCATQPISNLDAVAIPNARALRSKHLVKRSKYWLNLKAATPIEKPRSHITVEVAMLFVVADRKLTHFL